MSKNIESKSNKRRYPPFWEKFIPAAVVVLILVIAVLIIITIRVALGLDALPF